VRAEVGDAVTALYLHRPDRGRALLERALVADPAGSDQLLRTVWASEDVAGKLATAHRLVAEAGSESVGAWLRLWVSEVAAGQRAVDDPPSVLDQLAEPDDLARWELTVWRIATAIASGSFDRAQRLIDGARRSASRATSAATTVSRLATLTAQELRLTMLRSAERPSADQIAIPKQTWAQSRPIMASWRGYAAAAIGRVDAARAACDLVVDDLVDRRVPASELPAVATALATAAIEVDHTPGIAAAHRALVEHTGEHAINNFSVYWGAVDHHLARLAAASGDLDEAVERYESAVAQHRHARARPYEARSLHGLAATRWHRSRGRDRQEAETSHRLAVALAGELAMSSIGHASWPPVSALV